jgi:hypothetical protein
MPQLQPMILNKVFATLVIGGRQIPGPPGSATFRAAASEAIPANSLIYIKSNGAVALANASAEGKEAVAFVKESVALDALATCHAPNEIWDGLSGLTPGATYYMSTTPGAFVISASAPSTPGSGNVLMGVGTALSATKLLFKPGAPITL